MLQHFCRCRQTAEGRCFSKGTAGSKGAAGSTGFESVKGDRKGGNRSTAQGETETKGGNLLHKISNREKLAKELGIGVITLEDIVSELEKPSRDPRENMPAPILRQDVLDMKDLQPGMILKGTVRNIIDFGCFVDIGVHQDGLVHISQITDRQKENRSDHETVNQRIRLTMIRSRSGSV